MDLNLYKYFNTVAKCKNILRASQELYISQPALSRAIMQLEKETGKQLFVRSPKGVSLTMDGEILYSYVKQALSFIDTANKKIKDQDALTFGHIHIGCSHSICKNYLIPAVCSFNDIYPNIKINTACRSSSDALSLVQSGLIDFGIVTDPMDISGLVMIPLFEIQDIFVAGSKYFNISAEKKHIWEIDSSPFIFLPQSSNTRKYLDTYFKAQSVIINAQFEAATNDLAMHMAINNLGIAYVIKNFVKNELKEKTLYEIKLFEKIPERKAYLAYLNKDILSPAAKCFTEHLLQTGKTNK